MYFRFAVTTIMSTVRLEKGVVRRMMSFDTRLDTMPGDLRPSITTGGAQIDDLPCNATLYCKDEKYELKDGEECLLFYSEEYSSERDCVPASLHLQVFLPAAAFDVLWRLAFENRAVTFHGEIDRKALKERDHNPIAGGSTFEWDVTDRMKVVESLSFRQSVPSDIPAPRLGRWTTEYPAKYEAHSQMRRLCLDIAGQVEAEAARRNSIFEECHSLTDVFYNLERFYQHCCNGRQEVWRHQDGSEDLDRIFAEDAAVEVLVSLLERPWLRCDELEWAMVDYLVFWETHGFSDQLPGIIAALPRWPSRKGLAARERLVILEERMRWAYACLRSSGACSPYQIREALLLAQAAGASWKPIVFAILDRATCRDPPMWMIPM